MLAFTNKPSIDYLELEVPKKFLSLINFKKDWIFMGPVSFPNFQRVSHLTRPRSLSRVKGGRESQLGTAKGNLDKEQAACLCGSCHVWVLLSGLTFSKEESVCWWWADLWCLKLGDLWCLVSCGWSFWDGCGSSQTHHWICMRIVWQCCFFRWLPFLWALEISGQK